MALKDIIKLTGLPLTKQEDGSFLLGRGTDAIILKLDEKTGEIVTRDGTNRITGHYPDMWPWDTPHDCMEDEYIDFSLNPDIPPDNSPVARLPLAIRELKRAWLSLISLKEVQFSDDVEDGDFVSLGLDGLWHPVVADNTNERFGKPAFRGVAYLDQKTVLFSNIMKHKAWNFSTVDGDVYLSADQPGKSTQEETNSYLGKALASDTLFFDTASDYVDDLVDKLREELEAAKDEIEKKIGDLETFDPSSIMTKLSLLEQKDEELLDLINNNKQELQDNIDALTQDHEDLKELVKEKEEDIEQALSDIGELQNGLKDLEDRMAIVENRTSQDITINIFNFKEVVESIDDLPGKDDPNPPAVGDIYYVGGTENKFYVWNGEEWVPIQGVEGVSEEYAKALVEQLKTELKREIDALSGLISKEAAPNKVPQAGDDGKISKDWLPADIDYGGGGGDTIINIYEWKGEVEEEGDLPQPTPDDGDDSNDPKPGDIFYVKGEDKFYIWNGTKWVPIQSIAGVDKVYIDNLVKEILQNGGVLPATSLPLVAEGIGRVGTSAKYAREDHVHPLQTNITGTAAKAIEATTAEKLKTPRTITLTGFAQGSASFDGSSNITINTTGQASGGSTSIKLDNNFLMTWWLGAR